MALEATSTRCTPPDPFQQCLQFHVRVRSIRGNGSVVVHSGDGLRIIGFRNSKQRGGTVSCRHHACTRYRILLRRNRCCTLRHCHWSTRTSAAFPGRDAPALRRGRTGTRLSGPHSPRAAAHRSGPARGWREPLGYRGYCLHRWSRVNRRPPRWRLCGNRCGLGSGGSGDRYPSSRRPPAQPSPVQRSARFPVCCPPGFWWPYPTARSHRHRTLSLARRYGRRCRWGSV